MKRLSLYSGVLIFCILQFKCDTGIDFSESDWTQSTFTYLAELTVSDSLRGNHLEYAKCEVSGFEKVWYTNRNGIVDFIFKLEKNQESFAIVVSVSKDGYRTKVIRIEAKQGFYTIPFIMYV